MQLMLGYLSVQNLLFRVKNTFWNVTLQFQIVLQYRPKKWNEEINFFLQKDLTMIKKLSYKWTKNCWHLIFFNEQWWLSLDKIISILTTISLSSKRYLKFDNMPLLECQHVNSLKDILSTNIKSKYILGTAIYLQ